MALTTGKVDMFTEIYVNHANGTIKDLVAKDKPHRISRREIEYQILEGIDNSEFPTAFRIVFYSMVLHTNTFDGYWFGQQNLLGLPKFSITRLKPDMSLLRNLHGTGALDILTSLSSDESDASGAEESEEEDIFQNDDLDTTKVPTPFDPANDPAYSLINRGHVSIEPSEVEFSDREEESHPARSSTHTQYPTPNETPVQRRKCAAAVHDENETQEGDYTIPGADWMTEDMLDEDYIDPSFIDCPVITAFGIPLNNPAQVNMPASSPVPKPGDLTSKSSAKGRRGGGPKKQVRLAALPQ
ncbi:hypothetical protein McanMca71_003839 [Microsporum canis]|uniref:Uncharacterized protein n=1 Tax=Arthroderma otae (strain ATCC MYA-4605 / CBS 113480) TaxID=554155 RepID=C5FV80_ARTOC|nr:uncharacterized protein MCYG_06633 [Microsporum canis CBS 113480]EEQ33814.1 predicted protein [Microsporum canis CBS 113480]